VQKKPVVVLDTNVFVSGLLTPNGVPGAILRRFRQGDFEVVMCQEQISEIQDVLKRTHIQKLLSKDVRKTLQQFIRHLKKAVTLVRPAQQSWDFSDEGDHFLLDLVATAKPDFLVTGDKKLRSVVLVGDTSVVTPTEFLARL
jgi:uncharacterized protein